jgi:hypothetical protein
VGYGREVAFSPNGKTIAAGYRSFGDGGGAGGVVLFDLDIKSWQRIAGRIANRNFTRDEWRQYFPDEHYHRTFRTLPWPDDLTDAERRQQEAWEKAHPDTWEERIAGTPK